MFAMLLLVTTVLSACGKASKEECENYLAEGNMEKFEKGECSQYIMEEFENLFN